MKKLILFIGLLASCAPATTDNITDLCKDTVLAYGPLRDNGPAIDYAALFTTDGTFTLGPNTTTGRDALVARFDSANTNLQWQHFMHDIEISNKGGAYFGKTRFQIFNGPRTDKPAGYTREILGHYDDEFSIEDGKCFIKARRVTVVFDNQKSK